MKKRMSSVSLVLVFGLLACGVHLYAQQSPASQDAQQPQSQQQPTPPQQSQPSQQPDQAGPDSQNQSQSAGQTFTGLVIKSGDKYVLQASDSGATYDIDRQDEVKKFEGKRVRVRGVLDPNGKLIHVQ
jgi:hypothetical protein